MYLAECIGSTSYVSVTTCAGNLWETWTVNPSIGSIYFETCRSAGVTFPTSKLVVQAQAIFVKYRPEDLSVLQKASPGWGDWANKGGLSEGAKIAIGVTIPVVFLAFLLGVFVVVWRRRNKP